MRLVYLWGKSEQNWIVVLQSSCSYLIFRFLACFEQEVPWHSGNYTVWIHSEMRTWHLINGLKNVGKDAPQFLSFSKYGERYHISSTIACKRFFHCSTSCERTLVILYWQMISKLSNKGDLLCIFVFSIIASWYSVAVDWKLLDVRFQCRYLLCIFCSRSWWFFSGKMH